MTAKDKAIHDKGLVPVLKQLHDELDDAVLEAYGWDLRRHDIPVVRAERDAQGSLLTGDSAAALVLPRQECRGSLSFADILAACFGRKSQKRSAQISAILDTLRALGHIA